jgi:hypothetical protein
MINSDDIHFVSLKKKQQLRIKGQIGSFICNSRGVGEEADRLLKEMKFFASFIWHYDPCGIISEMRVKNKNIPYVHTSRPEIESSPTRQNGSQTLWLRQNSRTFRSLSHRRLHHRLPRRKGLGKMFHLPSLKYHPKNFNYIPRGQKPVRHPTRLVKRECNPLPLWRLIGRSLVQEANKS